MNRLMSIPPRFYEQAQQIAQQRPETFKNWQEAIRLAIHYGLPCIGQAQERTQELDQAAEVRRYINKSNTSRDRLRKALRNVPATGSVCCITEQKEPDCSGDCRTCSRWLDYQAGKNI